MPSRSSAWWRPKEQISRSHWLQALVVTVWPWLRAFASEVSLGLFLVMRIRRQVPGPEYVQSSVLHQVASFLVGFISWSWPDILGILFNMISRVLPFKHDFLPFPLSTLLSCLINLITYYHLYSFILLAAMRYTCGIHVVYHGLPGIKGVSHGGGACGSMTESWEYWELHRWRTRSSKVMTRAWVGLSCQMLPEVASLLFGRCASHMFTVYNWVELQTIGLKQNMSFEMHAARQCLDMFGI